MSDHEPDWRHGLREAGETELLELARRHIDEIDVRLARQVLRNPFVTQPVIELLLKKRALLTSSELRRDLVAHRQTPVARALSLVTGLFWKDLVALGANARVSPRLRRAADLRLGERLAQLGTGERSAIARRAGPGLMARLRQDPHPMVIGALLENPKLTEGHLLPMIASDTANPRVLARVAQDRRWGLRYVIKVALARNPRTPVPTALGLLSGLKKTDLMSVATDWRISAPVRQRADLLLGRLSSESGRI